MWSSHTGILGMLQEASPAKELVGALLFLQHPSRKGLAPTTVTKHLQRAI